MLREIRLMSPVDTTTDVARTTWRSPVRQLNPTAPTTRSPLGSVSRSVIIVRGRNVAPWPTV